MLKEATQQLLASGPLVVGTVHSLPSLRLAATLKPGAVDVLEYRLDAIPERFRTLAVTVRTRKIPWILTVRHPAEGGVIPFSIEDRREAYRFFIPLVDFIDIELRSLPEFEDLVEHAERAGCAVIVSSHDFKKTTPPAEILQREKRAFAEGADIFKLACVTEKAGDLATLLDFSERPARGLRSIMGMGRFGKASRLALAQAGSVLNYGYLHQPNAPGQWEARELRKLISAG